MARILIVDGNDPVRLTLTTLLRSRGHWVEQATNGQQALDLCASEDYDLVLMDVYMPSMDGLQACQELRQTSQVPVLMLSPLSDPLIEEHVYKSGANGLIPKPLNVDRLFSWVGTVLSTASILPLVSPTTC
jgi:two-component system response regulator ResD